MAQTKMPAMQWYPGDWRKDPGIQALDYHDRGVWRELLDVMHEAAERGRLVFPTGEPMPDAAIARLLGIPEAEWKQTRSRLISYGVASEDGAGTLYNRRMVRDERQRQAKVEAGRKGGKKSKPKQNGSKREANTEAKRGSSSSSSSSSSQKDASSSDLPSSRQETHRGTVDELAFAIGQFCEAVGSDWRLKTGIDDWAADLKRDPRYAGLDLPHELKRAAEYHQGEGRSPRAPDRSIRNWLEKAAEIAQRKRRSNGGGLPPTVEQRKGLPQAFQPPEWWDEMDEDDDDEDQC